MNVLLMAVFAFFATAESQIDLNITQLKPLNGQLYVAVFNKAAGFPDAEKAFQRKVFSTEGKKEMKISLKGLPVGTYAIAIYQDINNNKELDTNTFGVPKEPYGFTRNFKPRFSAPDFTDVAVKIEGKVAQFTINLIQ